jgi:hypothetical protein
MTSPFLNGETTGSTGQTETASEFEWSPYLLILLYWCLDYLSFAQNDDSFASG